MAFVSGFKNDVFISYARDDDLPDALEHKWVSKFRSDLTTALTQRLGQVPEVFFDNLKLDPFHHLRVLRDNARESAIFLPVLSPRYVARDWTIQELEAFCERGSHEGRMTIVELLPLSSEDAFPLRLQDLKRTRFWWKDEAIAPTAFRLTPKLKPAEYITAVDDFAERLAQRLRGLRKKNDGVGSHPHSASKLDKTVLIAQATDDFEEELNQLRRFLENYFQRVLPEANYPQGGAEFAKAFEADLGKADVFVQLLGNHASRRPPDLPQGYAQYQYAAALNSKRANRDLIVLQWRRPNLDTSRVTHRDQALLNGPNVIATGLEEFKREIIRICEAPKEKSHKDRGEFLFVNFDLVDQDIYDRLKKIFKAKDRTVFPPLFKGSAQEIDEERDENLLGCKALVIVYGKTSPRWVRAQIRRCNKVLQTRTEALEVQTILLCPPPPKDESIEIGVSSFHAVDCQNDASVERLERIIEELPL